MQATDLSPEIWNSIADLVGRSQAPREVYFVRVTKADKIKGLIWAEDFGGIAIPLVAHTTTFAYYDTVAGTANLSTGVVTNSVQKKYDPAQANPAFETVIICPKVGQTVVVLDPWGAKRFPICIGVIQSKPGFWEGE